MTLKGTIQRIRNLSTSEHGSETGERELTIKLNRESLRRLNRLRLKTKKADESELVSLALTALEQKVDKILKRQHAAVRERRQERIDSRASSRPHRADR
jgi:hypothetical protein